MKKSIGGFTLTELVVVVLIIGVLASVAISRMDKVVEHTYARDAIATVTQLGMSNKMFHMDNPTLYASGRLSSTQDPSVTACDGYLTKASGSTIDANVLIACHYTIPQNWDKNPYLFYVCDASGGGGGGCCSGNLLACAVRNPSVHNPNSTVATWTYKLGSNGICTATQSDGGDGCKYAIPTSETCSMASDSVCQ